MRPQVAALATWEHTAEVRADITEAVGPAPPELPPDDPRRALILAAAARLRGVAPPWLGDPVALLGSVRVGGQPLAGTPMSYDPLYDVLKVDRWVADVPPDLVAAVLLHELVVVGGRRRPPVPGLLAVAVAPRRRGLADRLERVHRASARARPGPSRRRRPASSEASLRNAAVHSPTGRW